MLSAVGCAARSTELTESSKQNGVYLFRYRRIKTFGFGGILLAIGAAIGWVAWDALDPAWISPNDDGALLQALPAWVRVLFFVATGCVLLVPGTVMVWAGLRNLNIVRADAEGISSRTIFGRRRYLPWQAIGSAKRWGRENQIALSPIGHGGLAEEIWDRKSVLIDVGMLDRPVADVEAMIRHFRPDLAIGYANSRDG